MRDEQDFGEGEKLVDKVRNSHGKVRTCDTLPWVGQMGEKEFLEVGWLTR